jgi:hypothetical protein
MNNPRNIDSLAEALSAYIRDRIESRFAQIDVKDLVDNAVDVAVRGVDVETLVADAIDDHVRGLDVESLVADAINDAAYKDNRTAAAAAVVAEIRSSTCKRWIEETACKAVADKLSGHLI